MTTISASLSAHRATTQTWNDPMKSILSLSLLAALVTFAPGAVAHDPAEHAKEAAEAKAGPNCEAMMTMDHSKMDPNDAVMKAMMKKCAQQKPAEHKGMEGMDHSKMPMPATAPKKSAGHEGH